MFEKRLKNNVRDEFMRISDADKNIFDYIIKMVIQLDDKLYKRY